MTQEEQKPYRVLARKYRPQNFSELVGQEALVRTLTNAINSGRVAHAFMLTGVRGVGKTTTARIIAKALNYTGPDGTSGPTTGPTDDCKLCRAIAEDRHPDVIEMDAASRTGVDQMRDLLDGVRYAPTEARFKIYIIDEVHMLSTAAFNALLKTLEEPPAHVKFIFATTEIRKVPITVLSRCQRFDLRRVDVPTLIAHFKDICAQEKVQAEDEALALIARAADGSVRDGLSLLDQAIALSGASVTAVQVKDMLGLADRARGLDLLEHALRGEAKEALAVIDDLYRAGADPVVIMQDLLDLTHLMTRLKAVPAAEDMKHAMAAGEVARAAQMAGKLSMPSLGKTWQILLKGLSEVQSAPDSRNAAEMVVIRLIYAANLPDPSDLIKKLQDGGSVADRNPPPSPPGGGGRMAAAGGGSVAAAAQPVVHSSMQPDPSTLEDVVAALEQAGEILLASQVYQFVHLVKLEPGRLEIRPAEMAPPRLAQDLSQKLSAVTDRRWMVSISGAPGKPTLAGQVQAAKEQEFAAILQTPALQNVIKHFPGARLIDIKKSGQPEKDTDHD